MLLADTRTKYLLFSVNPAMVQLKIKKYLKYYACFALLKTFINLQTMAITYSIDQLIMTYLSSFVFSKVFQSFSFSSLYSTMYLLVELPPVECGFDHFIATDDFVTSTTFNEDGAEGTCGMMCNYKLKLNANKNYLRCFDSVW